MAPRPWNPAVELEGAIARGDLRYAIALAEELKIEHGRPIPLDLALRLLPLAAAEPSYDGWACRWLARWLSETNGATIEQAAELAAALADLRDEPRALKTIMGLMA